MSLGPDIDAVAARTAEVAERLRRAENRLVAIRDGKRNARPDDAYERPAVFELKVQHLGLPVGDVMAYFSKLVDVLPGVGDGVVPPAVVDLDVHIQISSSLAGCGDPSVGGASPVPPCGDARPAPVSQHGPGAGHSTPGGGQ